MAQVLEIMRVLQDDVAASRVEQERMQADLAASQVVPPGLVGVKASFTGVEDPEAHLTAFHTQMMLSGGSDAVYCKLFMSTLSGIALEWFNQGESLRDYLSRFGAQVVRLPSKDEDMLVHAFKKGVLACPFSESLITHRPSTFAEIRRRAVAHIAAETAISEKRESAISTKSRAGPSRTQQPMRVHEAKEGKKAQGKPCPYEPQRDQNRGRTRESNAPPRFDFVVELAELIAIPAIGARLRAPEKTDKVLGRKKNVWCEFHQAYGHPLHTCLALGHQLAELVKSGFLSDYLRETQGDRASGAPV
ncbi:uncharacterized protein [Phaseolus vulgaris]|uniref:uncharacterized protein n=1 Tax=Phaseolus vulgaris TaxID=3885 RepID=UPI0035C9AC1F